MNDRWSKVTCVVVFGLTGVGTAILGATLPAILLQRHLSDSTGGVLLLAAWGGSTSGALFVGAHPQRSAARGLLLSSVGLFALTAHPGSALALMFLLYGFGLGLTMTSISVLRSRQVPAAHADVEMNRLNLVWAVGACAAPALALHSLHLLSVAGLFRLFGATLTAAALLLAVFSGSPVSPRQPELDGAAKSTSLAWAPLSFGLFAAAAVGIESAVGSWLTTYAERVRFGVGTAVSANFAFWAGLLVSRAMHSVSRAGWFHTPAARVLHMAATGVAMVLLVVVPSPRAIPVAALLCGLGLGPLYPYILSVALSRFRSTAVLVLAGVGASLVPWLTGTLSSRFGSLRVGLLAPVAAFVVLIVSAAVMRSGRGLADAPDRVHP